VKQQQNWAWALVLWRRLFISFWNLEKCLLDGFQSCLTVNRNRNGIMCQDLLARYRQEQDKFLSRIITCDETRVHHYTPESKQSSIQCKHVSSPSHKKIQCATICKQGYGLCVLGLAGRHSCHNYSLWVYSECWLLQYTTVGTVVASYLSKATRSAAERCHTRSTIMLRHIRLVRPCKKVLLWVGNCCHILHTAHT